MKLRINDTLIHQAESPRGIIYRMVIVYTYLAPLAILIIALAQRNHEHINSYCIVNSFSVIILIWLIRKSFKILSPAPYISTLIIGLFILLNSTLSSMVGGLNILDSSTTSIVAAILHAPAIIIIAHSFNKYITFVNSNYQSALSLAFTDELTGLPNRRHLNFKLKEIENKSCTLCIADIDYFKKINDTWGHEMGDKVLASIGLKLMNLSNENLFIARSGGEEFCIIITETTDAADQVRNILSFLQGGINGGVNITLSVGASIKKTNEMASLVMERADVALYQAKNTGKNRVVFN